MSCSRDSATVVWLRADVGTLPDGWGRVRGARSSMPTRQRSLAALDEVRRPLYATVADAVVDVDELTPDEVADRVLAALGRRWGNGRMRTVGVELGERRYDVMIGEGAADLLAGVVCHRRAGRRPCRGGDPGGNRVRRSIRGSRSRSSSCETARRRSRSQRSSCSAAASPAGSEPVRRGDRGRRRGGDRPGGLRGRELPAGRRLRERADVAARAGRRRHRREDRREPPGGQEPGGRLLAAARGALRHGGARHPATSRVVVGPRRDRQVRTDRRRGQPRVARSPRPALDEQVARSWR